MHPFTVNRLLVLAALVIAVVMAVLIFFTGESFTVITAIGWVFVVLAAYLASLLVP